MTESWRTINQVINKRSKSTKIDVLREIGSDVDDKQNIANTMNAYFCSVGKDLANKVETVPYSIVTGKCNLKPHNKQCILKAIGVQDIRETMLKMKTSKSVGSVVIFNTCDSLF